jgi:hypothetical protein
MTNKVITINGQEYEIKKLALGRYAKLIGALDNLPPEVMEELKAVDTSSTEGFMAKLPKLISKSWENILDVLSIASGIEKEVLSEECDLNDGVNIVKAIFEVNDFATVKKTLATLFQSKKEQEVAPQTKGKKIG